MKILDTLKNKGYRITKPRQEILKILEGYPITVNDIFTTLKHKKLSADLASVYRSMELFKKIGIVEEVELGDGKRRYELIDADNHHHHIVCNSCGVIEDITVQEDKILNEVKNKSNFQITKHSLKFFGICKSCQ